jgi:hypothetical protein
LYNGHIENINDSMFNIKSRKNVGNLKSVIRHQSSPDISSGTFLRKPAALRLMTWGSEKWQMRKGQEIQNQKKSLILKL